VKEKKIDRRVKYTLMIIRVSFVKLLKQKPISKITIKEICEDADINRSTFYAHYTDQYDLLNQIENEVIDDINLYLNRYSINNSQAPSKMLTIILEYIKQNSELFELFLSKGDFSFQQKITDVIRQQYFLQTVASSTISEDNAVYICLFYVNGTIGIVREWLLRGMGKPVNEIAELILSMEYREFR
jgi:AcrR family transcriptional regulator